MTPVLRVVHNWPGSCPLNALAIGPFKRFRTQSRTPLPKVRSLPDIFTFAVQLETEVVCFGSGDVFLSIDGVAWMAYLQKKQIQRKFNCDINHHESIIDGK